MEKYILVEEEKNIKKDRINELKNIKEKAKKIVSNMEYKTLTEITYWAKWLNEFDKIIGKIEDDLSGQIRLKDV